MKKIILVFIFTFITLFTPSVSHAQTPSFTFGAAGDFGTNSNFTATVNKVKIENPAFMLGLGDLAYATVEQSWCNTWKNAPYNNIIIIAGNHDSGESAAGNINSYIQYCPYTLNSPMTGSYGKQYYFDYPETNPIARFIMISPGLGGSFIGFDTTYTAGRQGYTFTSNAIDDARNKGIKWVIVGMHKNCLTMGTKTCEITAELLNLFLEKKVDLILQGHDHVYERSKQLSCATPNSFTASCVARTTDGNYIKGSGTVLVIVGTGGTGLYPISTTDTEAGYFAAWSGSNINPTYGFSKVTVTPTQISHQFIKSAGGTFTDNFTISDPTPQPSPNPSPAADADGDGNVTIADLKVLLTHFFGINLTKQTGDFNNDGKANALDFGLWITEFILR